MSTRSAAPPAGRSGRRGAEAGAPVKVPNGAPPGLVDAGHRGAPKGRVSPGVDAVNESKEAEGNAVPPAPEQTKEERAEMVQRALKKYSFYQVRLYLVPADGQLLPTTLLGSWRFAFVVFFELECLCRVLRALCVRTLSPFSFVGR